MKRNILFLFVATITIAGCGANNAPVETDEFVDCINCGNVNMVEYSMPNGNDLKLETDHHIVQIDGKPGKKYDYYVWVGDKTYADDPDIVVQDGNAAVLIQQ